MEIFQEHLIAATSYLYIIGVSTQDIFGVSSWCDG